MKKYYCCLKIWKRLRNEMCLLFCRTNSVKELEAFAENAVAVNRMILRHLSISEAFAPPVFNLANAFGDADEFEEKTPRFTIGDGDNDNGDCGGVDVDFQISSESDGEQAPGMWMGLSPPGKSSLARRRMLSKGSSEDDDSNSAAMTSSTTITKPRSPPKAPSALF